MKRRREGGFWYQVREFLGAVGALIVIGLGILIVIVFLVLYFLIGLPGRWGY